MDNFKILQKNMDSTAKIIGEYCEIQEKQLNICKKALKDIQSVLINEPDTAIAVDKILEIYGSEGLEECLAEMKS